jgi:hypothetical protein
VPEHGQHLGLALEQLDVLPGWVAVVRFIAGADPQLLDRDLPLGIGFRATEPGRRETTAAELADDFIAIGDRARLIGQRQESAGSARPRL